eukprot:m.102941 g.102941  ORF g.102941 m.102941 type:complete len:272 (-) comp15204_c0_seq4:1694-2509(-)
MKIAVLTASNNATGNRTFACRVQELLHDQGHHCYIWCHEDFTTSDELCQLCHQHAVTTIIGIHAYRSGRLLADQATSCRLRWILVLSGTDVSRFNSPIETKTMLLALKRADVRVALHDYMAKAMALRLDLDPNIFTIIRPSIRTHNPPQTTYDWSVITKHPNPTVFLLPAGLRPVKDVLHLGGAMARLHHEQPNVFFIVVGPVLDKAYAADVQSTALEWPNVCVLDAVPQVSVQDVDDLYSKDRLLWAIPPISIPLLWLSLAALRRLSFIT